MAPYFGTLPEYTQLWLNSSARNPQATRLTVHRRPHDLGLSWQRPGVLLRAQRPARAFPVMVRLRDFPAWHKEAGQLRAPVRLHLRGGACWIPDLEACECGRLNLRRLFEVHHGGSTRGTIDWGVWATWPSIATHRRTTGGSWLRTARDSAIGMCSRVLNS